MESLKEIAYRRLTHLNFRRWEECVTLVDWLDARPGDRVLDVGCGDGWWDHRIARTGCHVTGVDIQKDRLAIAQARNQTTQTDFHYMDAEAMTFPDGTFDRAISMCVIEHFRDDERVLAEIHRVTKPGAPLILSADSLSNPELRPEEREEHRRRFAVNNFYTPDLLRQKLDRAGFELEHWQYILTTPLTLFLTRLSWKIDDLEARPSRAARTFGEVAAFLMDTGGKALSSLGERAARREGTGLTLLARARHR